MVGSICTDGCRRLTTVSRRCALRAQHPARPAGRRQRRTRPTAAALPSSHCLLPFTFLFFPLEPQPAPTAKPPSVRLQRTCRPVRVLHFAHWGGRSRPFTRTTKSRPPFRDRLSPSISYARELWSLGGGPVREPARRPCRGAALPRSGGQLGLTASTLSDGNSPDDPSVRSHDRQARRPRRQARHPAHDHRDRRPNDRAGHRQSRR
jgi:hypothetical protein